MPNTRWLVGETAAVPGWLAEAARCGGGGSDGLSDAVRLCADEGWPGGTNPRGSWKCQGYAVQLAKQAELQVFATAGPADLDYVRGFGAEMVVNYKTTKFEDAVPDVDAVLDTVGGETQQRSFRVLKPGGILVSVVSPVPEKPPQPVGVRWRSSW